MSLDQLKQTSLFGANILMPSFLREEDLSSTLLKEILPLVKLEDFEGMYKSGGRPPVCPRVLFVVTLFQYLESLTDREAGFNIRYRIDWKVALGLELDYEGFHHSLLSRFRDRLLSNDKASMAFDLVISHLVDRGLVKKSSKQRIDSTQILGHVRELSRLELLHETLRLFCLDLDKCKVTLNEFLLDLKEKYSEKKSSYRLTKNEKDESLSNAGSAMKAFIFGIRSEGSPLEIQSLSSYKTLEKVYMQNFKDDDPDDTPPSLIKVATGKDHICSPHEPDARYGNKGEKGWLGSKAQVAETVTEQKNSKETNFITYAEVTDATDHDGGSVENYIDHQSEQGTTPGTVYGDTHCNTESNIDSLQEQDIDLKGPVIPLPPKDKTKEENQGFDLDLESETVSC